MNKKYAKFINDIIISSNEHKKDQNTNSFVMALNSSWGTGKTTFINDFMREYGNNKDYLLIKYDAWENDYWDNAFEPLIYSLMSNKQFKEYFDTQTANTIFYEASKEILKGLVQKFASKFMDEESIKRIIYIIKKGSKKLDKISKSEASNIYEEYSKFREALNNFKNELKNVQKHYNQKIVIFIDELDRCKPDFAIKTLEFVKHIFDIDNYVFIFSLDKSQLSKSMETIYGQKMNTHGYLNRFFDYTSNMPILGKKEYIQHRINSCEFNDDIKEQINTFLNCKDYSYRDINYFFVSLGLFKKKIKENIYPLYYRNLITLIYLKTLELDIFNQLLSVLYNNNNEGIDKNFKLLPSYNYFRHIERDITQKTTIKIYMNKHLGSHSFDTSNHKYEYLDNEYLYFTAPHSTIRVKISAVYMNFEYFEKRFLSQCNDFNQKVVEVLIEEIETINFLDAYNDENAELVMQQ